MDRPAPLFTDGEDYAEIGLNFMATFDTITMDKDSPYFGWTPAEWPSEILHVMLEEIERLRAQVARQPADPGPVDASPDALIERVAHDFLAFGHAEAENLRELVGFVPLRAAYGAWLPAVPSLVELIRRLGPAATPDVLAAQMKIDGYRETATLSTSERLALGVMAATVTGLRMILELARPETANAPEPNAPLRAEDSTYESAEAPGDLVA